MEKFITLEHLKKTAQSLILDTDSKINGLSKVAQTGSYNDLTNKPNENLTPYGYLEYENGYYRLHTNADTILQETGTTSITFPVFLNGINSYSYVPNETENLYLYLNDATIPEYDISFEYKSGPRLENWGELSNSDWTKFEEYFGIEDDFFIGYLNIDDNLWHKEFHVRNNKIFQKNEIPYIYQQEVSRYNENEDSYETIGKAFYKDINDSYQYLYPLTVETLNKWSTPLTYIFIPDSENPMSVFKSIPCIVENYYSSSGHIYEIKPLDNTINYYWRVYLPYGYSESNPNYFTEDGALIFQVIYEEKPDWNENNSSANDYIQNRTHYIEEVNNYTWCEDLEFSVTTSLTTTLTLFDLNTTDIAYGSNFKPNTYYTITLDSTNYSLTAYEYKNTSTNNIVGVAIGNSSLLPSASSSVTGLTYNSSAPFVIYKTYTSSTPQKCTFKRDSSSILDNTNHVITIKGNASIAHKIDNRYLNGKLIQYGSSSNAEILNSKDNIASGVYSHAEGCYTKASGSYSHAEGYYAAASGMYSHAEGNHSNTAASYSHAEGFRTIAKNQGSHVEGIITKAGQSADDFHGSHAEGYATFASGIGAHAEGRYGSWTNKKITKQAGSLVCTLNDPTACSCPIDGQITINNVWIFLQFYSTGVGSLFPINNLTIIDGYLRDFTLDLSQSNLTESMVTSVTNSETTDGNVSIFVGSMANGDGAHAEGGYTFALADNAHAEGWHTAANANSSHAEGYNTIASSANQHVQGKYNIIDSNNTYLDIVGNGTAHDARSNAYTLDWSGNGVYAGKVTVGTNPTNNMDVATKQYVDTATANIVTDLTSLTDTAITNPTEGQILTYDNTNSKWINNDIDIPEEVLLVTFTQEYDETNDSVSYSYDCSTNDIFSAFENNKVVIFKYSNTFGFARRGGYGPYYYWSENDKSYHISIGPNSEASITYFTEYIDQFDDVTITSPVEGQILAYNSTNYQWENITSPYLTETQVNTLIATALAEYGDGDIATYGYTDGNEVSY